MLSALLYSTGERERETERERLYTESPSVSLFSEYVHIILFYYSQRGKRMKESASVKEKGLKGNWRKCETLMKE